MSKAATLVPREDRHRNGSIRARGHELEGELHGYWEWFRLDGSLMRSGSLERGVQVGEWTTYDQDGAPYKVTKMKPRP